MLSCFFLFVKALGFVKSCCALGDHDTSRMYIFNVLSPKGPTKKRCYTVGFSHVIQILFVMRFSEKFLKSWCS